MSDKQQLTDEIIFYCKDCGEIVDTIKCGKKYVYKCKKCGTKNVAFGTKKSIYSFFHLDDKEKKNEKEEKINNEDKAKDSNEEKKEDNI